MKFIIYLVIKQRDCQNIEILFSAKFVQSNLSETYMYIRIMKVLHEHTL
jgi:hypothetical protein